MIGGGLKYVLIAHPITKSLVQCLKSCLYKIVQSLLMYSHPRLGKGAIACCCSYLFFSYNCFDQTDNIKIVLIFKNYRKYYIK